LQSKLQVNRRLLQVNCRPFGPFIWSTIKMQKHRSWESGSQPELEEVFRWEVASRSLIDAGLRIYARVDKVGKEQPLKPQLWLCKRSMINLQKAGLVYDLIAKI
jgi:hypothetical protein